MVILCLRFSVRVTAMNCFWIMGVVSIDFGLCVLVWLGLGLDLFFCFFF